MLKIFIVDDEELIREGIRNCLQKEAGCTYCGEAADGEMALPMLQEIQPDVLIADVRMPFMDGLELAAHVKHSMPWTHIIILSGHDEFEYAQKAISLGVDAYILKPVNAMKLREAVQEVEKRISREKQEYENIVRLQKQDENKKLMLREHFLVRLVTGGISTGEILKEADEIGIDLPARHYVACRIVLENVTSETIAQIRALCTRLFEGRHDVIWFLRGNNRLIYMVKGDSEKAVQERAYEAAQQLRHEMLHFLGLDISVSIGSMVSRIGELPRSYADASSLMNGRFGLRGSKIIGFGDVQNDRISPTLDFSAKTPLQERLRHTTPADIERILDIHFGDIDGQDEQSTLYRYYLLMDLTLAAGRLAGELGGNPDEATGELRDPQKALAAAVDNAIARQYAQEMLVRLCALQKNSEVRYGSEIRRAREYIAVHYSDMDISLHTVAAEVGFSPNHFSAVFSQETGETFVEYLTRKRIEAACTLLADTERRLSDIAFDIGYSEPRYFSYIFKKHTGKTPTEYRSHMREENFR